MAVEVSALGMQMIAARTDREQEPAILARIALRMLSLILLFEQQN